MSYKNILLFSLGVLPAALSATQIESASFAQMVKDDLPFPAVQVYKAESAELSGDYDTAAKHYIKAIQLSYTKAVGNIAHLIDERQLSEGVSQASAKEIEKLASEDLMLSLFLGDFYENDPLSKSLNDAFFWYNNAMRLGSVDAMERVATFTLNSLGGADRIYSYIDALTMYRKVVDVKATPEIALRIADTLYEGNLIQRDFAMAKDYYEVAEKGGLADASYKLGYMYEKGLGVDVNMSEAVDHYNRALTGESAREAYYRLARINLYGDDSLKDPIQGYTLLKKSASLGQVDAQYKLGLMHLYGTEFVKADTSLAVKYFDQASQSGFRMATIKLMDIYSYGAAGIEPSKVKVRELEKRLAK